MAQNTPLKTQSLSISGSIRIHSPVDSVWNFVFKPETALLLDEDLKANEKLTPGEVKVGTRFRKTFKTGNIV